MPVEQLEVPIVVLAFNRPDTTRVVFDAVRKMRPATLLLVMDAPRRERPDDIRKCEEVRAVLENVDWPCRVLKDYARENMGARRRVSTGITWAFSKVEEAIILEDDCVPTVEFFQFCENLLERYRDDNRVMHIGGTNLAQGKPRSDSSYLFSRYALSWGWATWRRAWNLYDSELSAWPNVREGGWLRDCLGDDDAAIDQWTMRLDAVYRNEFDSWASIWMFSCWIQNGLSIIPSENQIMNIGLGGADATHTKGDQHLSFTRQIAPLEFPLRHPKLMIRDAETDRELASRPLMIKNYSGLRGWLRHLRALRARPRNNILWERTNS